MRTNERVCSVTNAGDVYGHGRVKNHGPAMLARISLYPWH